MQLTKEGWKRIWKEQSERPLTGATLCVFLFDVVLVACSWWLRIRGPAWSLVACPMLLLAMAHAYLIMHEAAHKLVSRRGWLNDAVGHACSLLIGLPFLPRQRNHLGHHVWAGHPLNDPENSKLIRKFKVITDDEVRKLDRVWHSWVPLIALNHIKDTWRDPFVSPEEKGGTKRMGQERAAARGYLLCHVVVVSVAALADRLGTLASWYLPAWFFFLMFIELANLPHHAETPLLAPDDDALQVWDQGTVSHSCSAVPVWSRWVMLNFNLHVAHHLFPQVPWYRVPETDRLVRGDEPCKSELGWALANRRRSLVQIMGHYFDKRGEHE